MGHSTAVHNPKTRKCETVDKGETISIFGTIVAFEPFFVCIHAGTVYHILQREIDDGVIRNVVPKKRK